PRYTGSGAAAESEAEAEIGGTGTETILLVEDDPEVRAYLVEALTDLNYHVHAAADGAAALALVDRPSLAIDLLLTDVVLPGMDGRQVADAARQRRPGLRVLYMTGYSRNAIVHHGRLDPGVEIIQKPIVKATLSRRIREVLDSGPRRNGA
ncbi:MAG: response regulator, partial [Rhodospirillaceae bacterium]|nr:response regulator [Rhodospirillaceae bacterium]